MGNLGKRKFDFVPVKIEKTMYDKLMHVGVSSRPKLTQRAMVEDALDLWLEVKAPILMQNSKKQQAT